MSQETCRNNLSTTSCYCPQSLPFLVIDLAPLPYSICNCDESVTDYPLIVLSLSDLSDIFGVES